MKLQLAFTFIMVAAVGTCESAANPEPMRIADSAYFSISTFRGKSFRVNITGNKALYQTGPRAASQWEEINLSPEKVAQYFAGVQALGVTSWQDEYRCGLLDGVGWELEAFVGDNYVVSNGANAFPPRFTELLKLTGDLIGRPITAKVRPCPQELK